MLKKQQKEKNELEGEIRYLRDILEELEERIGE